MNSCFSDTLLPVETARARLLDAVTPLSECERLPLTHALDRITSQDIVAPTAVPPHATSAMDGFALSSRDIDPQRPFSLTIHQRIAAGQTGVPLAPGCAARIFTGAALPPGADTVVMQENCHVAGSEVTITPPLAAGEFVRPAGDDVQAGQCLVAKGHRLRPQDLGQLASAGVSTVQVFRRLKVALISTGDELVTPGEPLTPGKIYNANHYMLHGLLQRFNCQVIDGGCIPDRFSQTLTALEHAVSEADLVITSGGVSVGEEDHVKNALQQLGELQVWRIAVKPGKPLAFALVKGRPVIALPGNPVSSLVTFCLFGRPVILRLQGQNHCLPLVVRGRAAFSRTAPGKREEYLRARWVSDENREGWLTLYPNQSSGALSSTVWAQGLVRIPVGQIIHQGDLVDFLPFPALLDGHGLPG